MLVILLLPWPAHCGAHHVLRSPAILPFFSPRSSFPPAASRKEQQSWHVLLPSSHLAMTNTAHQNAQLGMQEY